MRAYPAPGGDGRSPFERDRDRIVQSRAFRRLAGKTQVFTSRASDHFRSRLTHTIEVAQVARRVAAALGLNADLAEALSRDGRTPEAVDVLNRGISAEPYAPELYKSLALRYISLKNYTQAKQTMQRYVELFPEDDFMRGLLAQVESPGGAR